jgi:beta-barrel assembly-enhancing protease
MNISSMLALFLVLIAVSVPDTVMSAEDQAWRQRISAGPAEMTGDDVTEEIRFGREVAARLIGRYGLYSNDALTKYVNLVGLSLAAYSNRPELKYYFAVLNTSEINAYAAPGGYIFITKGAINKMQDESELAGVIAHEMGHINGKHVVKELDIKATEGSATAGLARLIGGGTESARLAFSKAVDQAMDTLFKTGYKREDEIQADKGSVMLCTVSGYDPAGLIRYFERISAAKGKPTEVLDRTHPAYDARITLLKDTIKSAAIDPAALKTYKDRFAQSMKTVK